MNRNGWVGKALLALAVLVPVLGMGISIYLATTGNSLGAVTVSGSADEDSYVLTAADFPDTNDIGNQVGYRIPDFTLELADGSTVTSSGLVEEGRPTYLFFWATI